MKLPTSIQFPVITLGVAAALVLVGHLSAGTALEEPPKPFDPLSQTEQETAIAHALGSPLVSDKLGDRHMVIGASLNTDKGAMKVADPPRRADVVIYDYTDDQVVHAIVDLALGAVVELVPVLHHYQPTLTGAEMLRAEALAADYPGVDEALPDHHEILRASHLAGPEVGCEERHRCVIVGHYIDDFPDFSFFVVVDLSEDRATHIVNNDWWTEEANA